MHAAAHAHEILLLGLPFLVAIMPPMVVSERLGNLLRIAYLTHLGYSTSEMLPYVVQVCRLTKALLYPNFQLHLVKQYISLALGNSFLPFKIVES